MKIVAIIPAFNEESTVADVVRKTKKYAKEVLVIDDGSTDATAAKAKAAGAIVISHHTNKGLAKTITDGYTEALKRRADIVLQLDADGQYLPEEIPKLLEPILKNRADMVLGSRFEGTIEEMPYKKKFGNRLFSKLTSMLSGMKISDAQTGFRAMTRDVAETVIPTSRYTYTQEMIIRAAKEGYDIVEVPIYFAKRTSGKSRLVSNIFSYGVNAIVIIMKTFREHNPLVFFGGPGLLLFLIGFVYGAYLFNIYITTGSIAERIGSVMFSTFLMMSGLILGFMAMLADMLQAKYKQIREHIKRLGK